MKVTRAACLIVLCFLTSPSLAADPEWYADTSAAQSKNSSYSSDGAWSRPYVGIFGGVATGNFEYTTNITSGDLNVQGGGLEGGLRAGYDYATGGFLIGAVADVAISNLRAGLDLGVPGWGSETAEAKLAALGTFRGRLGFTHKNNLFYVHGGAAVGKLDMTVMDQPIPGIIDNARVGYVIGAGVEYAVAEHATFQTEYSFVDLAKFDVYSQGGADVSDRLTFHKLATGINMRF